MHSTSQAPIVVGVADHHPAMLDYANAEARRAGCGIRIVHAYIVPPSAMGSIYGMDVPASFRTGGEEIADEAVRYLRKGGTMPPVESIVERGHAPAVLESASHDARLMVIGPDDPKPWLLRMFEGRVARRLVENAACPTVVVPDSWDPTYDAKPVVVMVDGESSAHGPLAYAFATALARGTVLQVLYVDAGSSHDRPSEQQAIQRIVDTWFEANREVRGGSYVVHGDVRDAAMSAASGAGLLVLGRPHERRVTNRMIDSLAQTIIAAAGCPVAVVPAGFRS